MSQAPRASAPDSINEVVCPWWQQPYGDQLQEKHGRVVQALTSVTRAVRGGAAQRPQKLRATSAACSTLIPPVRAWPSCLLQVQGRLKAGKGAPPAWLQAAAPGGGTLPRPAAPVLGILRSPQLNGYRNKNEFTCGHDKQGLPTTGFLLGSYTVRQHLDHLLLHSVYS